MELELKNKDINKFKYLGSSNHFFTCYDRISITYGIIFNSEFVIFFNSEFVIFDILCNIIEETYGE
jgi:hypothetical protein